jgi:hypothetical protein
MNTVMMVAFFSVNVFGLGCVGYQLKAGQLMP